MGASPSYQGQWGQGAAMAPGGMAIPRPKQLWRARVSPNIMLLTAFWVYVALSNVLYASSMQASLAAMNVAHFYAPWNERLLQHVFLYPLLLLCVSTALRVGWQPLALALPVQLFLGLVFCVLASPAMGLAEIVLVGRWHHAVLPMLFMSIDRHSWIASATSFFLTYGFGLALVTGFAFYQRLRDSELRTAALERALSAAQLSSLRMQLSPHTLFNLLHTIRGHITWDPAQAQAMVVQLGDLLRGLLTNGSREFTPLSEEMQFVRLYLGLQQKRFADRMSVVVPPKEELPRVWVPSLILQPLIENAVVHGLAGHEGPVAIRVEALAREETLLLRISNTMGSTLKSPGTGIGLKNVRERLAIQFGARASLHAVVGLDHRWLAEIRMPLLRDGRVMAPEVSYNEPSSRAAP